MWRRHHNRADRPKMGRGKNWATQNWAEKAEIAETRLAEED